MKKDELYLPHGGSMRDFPAITRDWKRRIQDDCLFTVEIQKGNDSLRRAFSTIWETCEFAIACEKSGKQKGTPSAVLTGWRKVRRQYHADLGTKASEAFRLIESGVVMVARAKAKGFPIVELAQVSSNPSIIQNIKNCYPNRTAWDLAVDCGNEEGTIGMSVIGFLRGHWLTFHAAPKTIGKLFDAVAKEASLLNYYYATLEKMSKNTSK